MSARAQVDFLLDALDSAFQRPIPADWSDGWHSLLSNLQHVRDEDWDWLPPDGVRNIHRIALHCGVAMRVYADYGFGTESMQWPDAVPPGAGTMTKADAMPWLIESYTTLRNALAACTDGQLDDPRKTWDAGPIKPAPLVRHDDDRAHPLPRRRNQLHPRPRPEER